MAFTRVAFPAAAQKFQQNYVIRNSTPTEFFAVGWDGTTGAGKKLYTVPNGSYVVQMTAALPIAAATTTPLFTRRLDAAAKGVVTP